jgi:hypothetical protein
MAITLFWTSTGSDLRTNEGTMCHLSPLAMAQLQSPASQKQSNTRHSDPAYRFGQTRQVPNGTVSIDQLAL